MVRKKYVKNTWNKNSQKWREVFSSSSWWSQRSSFSSRTRRPLRNSQVMEYPEKSVSQFDLTGIHRTFFPTALKTHSCASKSLIEMDWFPDPKTTVLLSSSVKAFLPRSKHFFISWVKSPSGVIFGAQENKIFHCFHFSLLFAMKQNCWSQSHHSFATWWKELTHWKRPWCW